MNAPALDISDDDMHFRKAPSEDRIGFVRKVLGIVGAQLVVTALFTGIVLSSEGLIEIVQNSTGLLILSAVLALFTSIALICSKTLSRTVPYNYLTLLVFTLCESYGVASVCTFYETEDVLVAAFLAGVLTVALTAYSYYCVDFEVIKYMGVTLIVVIVLMIIDLFTGYGNNKMFIALGLFIYGIYLIIDVHRLVNESRFGMTMDDYIIGAILIYLDIIMIFIKILEIIGKKK